MSAITRHQLDRWERAARQRPTMGSELVLVLIAALRDAADRAVRDAARIGIAQQIATRDPHADGYLRLDVAEVLAHGATIVGMFDVLAELHARGVLDVGVTALDGWALVLETDEETGEEFIPIRLPARDCPLPPPAGHDRKLALLRALARAA